MALEDVPEKQLEPHNPAGRFIGAIGWLPVVTVACALSAAGCGGGTAGTGLAGPPGCGEVQACGGSVAGTWTFEGGCLNTREINAELATDYPGTSMVLNSLSAGGFIRLDGAGGYVSGEQVTATATVTVPLSTLGATSCGNVRPSCTGSDVCTCQASEFLGADGSGHGVGPILLLAWDQPGGSVGLMEVSQQGGTCVQGNTLHFLGLSLANAADGGSGPVVADIMATKTSDSF
jgi:hypothetical protein